MGYITIDCVGFQLLGKYIWYTQGTAVLGTICASSLPTVSKFCNFCPTPQKSISNFCFYTLSYTISTYSTSAVPSTISSISDTTSTKLPCGSTPVTAIPSLLQPSHPPFPLVTSLNLKKEALLPSKEGIRRHCRRMFVGRREVLITITTVSPVERGPYHCRTSSDDRV